MCRAIRSAWCAVVARRGWMSRRRRCSRRRMWRRVEGLALTPALSHRERGKEVVMTMRLILVSMLLVAAIVAPVAAGSFSAAVEMNNRAVALERAGDFSAAGAGYAAALAQSDDAGIRANLW